MKRAFIIRMLVQILGCCATVALSGATELPARLIFGLFVMACLAALNILKT